MLALNDLNTVYIDLYTELRKYIWDINMVECLAQFEVEVYNRLPDLDKVKHNFDLLKCYIVQSDIYADDEDLQRAVKTFENALDGISEVYSPIQILTPSFNEEDQPNIEQHEEEFTDGYEDYEDEEEDYREFESDEEDKDSRKQEGKRVFNIERISKSDNDREF